ncbi:MAG: nucleotide-binding protein [Acidimicrobiia bacterium]
MTTYEEERTTAELRCSDRFDDDLPIGEVIGTVGPAGALRRGVDVEGRIAIDNGALRFRPLAQPGWGREGIAYGPFPPVPGLAFSAHVLNGHNASQTFYFPETRKVRIRRVLSDIRHRRPRRQHHYENLAVGLFPDAVVADPLRDAHSFVMHAATADNGELWTAHRGRAARMARGVLNVPFVYVVALRPTGAAYYLASVPDATGASAYPHLRPVGIDPRPTTGPVVAGIHQRILGEVGYSVDTRVYGTEVAVVDAWARWYGTAVAADRLVGEGDLQDRLAELGGLWFADPTVRLSDRGAVAGAGIRGQARLSLDERGGLLHLLAERGTGPGEVELRWRVAEDSAHVAVVLSERGASVRRVDPDGTVTVLVEDPTAALPVATTVAVQLLDDGTRLGIQVDGRLVGGTWVPAPAFDGGGVGFVLDGDVAVRDLEVHPQVVELPAELDTGAPWTPPPSAEPDHERFDAEPAPGGAPLTIVDLPGWERSEGEGMIDLVDGRAVVRASVAEPNPGRTIFTRPWDDPLHADVELEMTMPGTRRGEGENGRCGVVFWQDPDNYLVVNLYVDDDFDGASISTFYHLGGEENMYDAVWTLVRGVVWGGRCTLRTVFDGERFVASTNGEPGLVRALRDVYPDAPRLRIERVGIIVNEEWGDDTGSLLHRFSTARGL